MKKRRFIGFFYLFLVGVVVVNSTNTFSSGKLPSGHNGEVDKLKYQLSHTELYGVPVEAISVLSNTGEKISDKKLEEKSVYLTFDDGPSPQTEGVLDVLAKYDVKATFFVVNPIKEEHDNFLRRTVGEGHAIAIHSASHKYNEIYKNIDSFLEDFSANRNYIETITGDAPDIFRFPGGSANKYNRNISKDVIEELTRRGFVYFDWNVCGEDSTSGISAKEIANNVLKGCKGKENSVVLLHDSSTKKETVKALDIIIPDLLEKGYVFKVLDKQSPRIVFSMD